MNWRRFFRRAEVDAEQREELEFYVDVTAEEYIERGMDPDAARAAARRKLGNPTLIREEIFHMNTLTFLEGIFSSVRHALRMIRTRPGFSVAALVSLALGIGANTAIFTVLSGVLIRPLPYPNAGALVSVANRFTINGQVIEDAQLSPGMYAACRDNSRVFEQFGVWGRGAATVTGRGDPEQVVSITVTQGVLPTLGVAAALGQWFSSEDDTAGTPETVILSHGFWQRKFGGDPAVIGRTVTIDFIPRRIAGVMPRHFRFMDLNPDVFLPQRFPGSQLRSDVFSYSGIGRLRPGVTVAVANEDIARVWKNWGEAERVTKMLALLKVQPNVHELKRDVIGDVGSVLTVIMGALALVLLLVCANVANLVLVRAESRRQEFAIRAALGAGWGRIAGELLVESLTLGMLGGALGLGLAYLGLRLLVTQGPGSLPRLAEISLNPAAVGFALACSLGSSLLFGLVAVAKSAVPGRMERARGTTQTSAQLHTQNTLVVTQVALALVLVVASGLLIRSFLALRAVSPGFSQPERIQTVRISLPQALTPDPERVIRLQADILTSLAAIPGVTAAGFASALPLEYEYSNGLIIGVEGKTSPDQMPPNRSAKNISPGLLAAQGTRLRAGRDFTWDDVFGKRYVAIISESMAREYWGEPVNALGKRLRPGRDGAWTEIVGVAEDVHDHGLNRPAPPTVYLRVGVTPQGWAGGTAAIRRNVAFAIRSERAGSQTFLRDVTAAIHGVNSGLPLAKVRLLDELYRSSMARTSFALVLLGIAGALALILSIVGVYGVLAYALAQRRREVSIRLALGAEPSAVKASFVRRGMVLAAAGGVIGLASAAGLSRWIASLLFGVTAYDPLTYLAAGAVIGTAALAASYFPARQAAAVDPMETLRCD